jgi:hypothetical protein
MTLEKKLIEKQKNKNNTIKDEHNQKDEKKLSEEKSINQSKMDSWKENKENNTRYKKSKYKGNNYNSSYNNKSIKFFYSNKKYFKDYKTYKSPYFHHLSTNNYNNHKKNYIEKEIELNSKGETEGDSEVKISEPAEENMKEGSLDSNHKSNIDFNSQENSEELNTLEYLNIDLMKSQSEDLSYKNLFDFHDIGIKLFPGAFQYEKKRNYEKRHVNATSNIKTNNFEENKRLKVSDFNFDKVKDKNDLECNNYLCKTNCSNNKIEQKKGLALALDYYSSFLEDKIK